MLRPGQILYTYLHLAPDPEQTKDLIESGAVCIAYETVTDDSGELPLLKPMSQVAGRLATQVGATALQKLGGVIGAVLIPGAAAPKLVTREMLSLMKEGAVLVDVAIDQGGCFETSRPTTHADPTYIIDGVVHYCVANMPAIKCVRALCNGCILPNSRSLLSIVRGEMAMNAETENTAAAPLAGLSGFNIPDPTQVRDLTRPASFMCIHPMAWR